LQIRTRHLAGLPPRLKSLSTGLDTFKAYKVVKILDVLARTYGRTIVCTIHQPSSEIFHLFDDLILLADGQVMYHGPVEQTVDYFAKLGYTCPDNCNPADYIFMEVGASPLGSLGWGRGARGGWVVACHGNTRA
jgi:hypothetical protein